MIPSIIITRIYDNDCFLILADGTADVNGVEQMPFWAFWVKYYDTEIGNFHIFIAFINALDKQHTIVSILCHQIQIMTNMFGKILSLMLLPIAMFQ